MIVVGGINIVPPYVFERLHYINEVIPTHQPEIGS
jgi:hypothetical protein